MNRLLRFFSHDLMVWAQKRYERLQDYIQYRIKTYRFSIRRFLVTSLLTMLTLLIIILALLNYVQLKKQNEHIFQVQLVNAAQVLDALTGIKIKNDQSERLSELLKQSSKMTLRDLTTKTKAAVTSYYLKYQNELVFQIWNNDTNTLIMKSENAPTERLSNKKSGFDDVYDHNGIEWHSFTLNNPDTHTQIVIAVKESFRRQINMGLFIHDLSILLIVYLIIAAIIITIIQFGLSHLERIAKAVSKRQADKLEAIDLGRVPIEILPIVEALNELFVEIQTTLKREKRFTADAAHELRTPLAALKTQTEVALREQDQNEQARILRNIIMGTNRCAHVVDQLLTLSRLEPEAKLENEAPVALQEVCRELIAELVPVAMAKNIELAFEAPEHTLTINGNAIAIGILLRNLIDNAIRYTPNKGTVLVQLSTEGQNIILQVIDNGPGVPPEDIKRIFDRFFRQVGNKAEGSGLGLSIVQQIVRLHRATIVAKAPEDQQGLEMCVTFTKPNYFTG